MSKKKSDSVPHVDSVTELGAYGLKGLFSALGSWKKTFRLALILGVSIAAAVAAKHVWMMLK